MLDVVGGDAGRLICEIGVVDEDPVDVVERPDGVVEPDSGKAGPGLVLTVDPSS